ncbi:hypothetical protein CVA01_20270 [Corynebacterium variabile]|uniref:Uncharacterized protein n=1 Tax=Corynebacterium variabile TaxID=1727 RepID=A0A4Y4C6F1_9CORY|nr:hypothetical protein CVA01_20270 [Corynebacterium variabile]
MEYGVLPDRVPAPDLFFDAAVVLARPVRVLVVGLMVVDLPSRCGSLPDLSRGLPP